MARELRDLAPPDAADLKIAAGRQLELARMLDRLLQEMDQAGTLLRQSDPLAAELVADALGEARRLAIAAEMRNAGDQIRQNQIGQATAGQEQIARACRKCSTCWPIARRQEAVRLVKKLRELQSDLARPCSRVRRICERRSRPPRKTKIRRPASASWSGLPPGSEQLRDETQRLARQLERLQPAAAAQAAAQAAATNGSVAGQGRAGGLRRRGRSRGRSPKVAGRRPPPT